MTTIACREQLRRIARVCVGRGPGQPAHAGLLLQRYLEIPVKDQSGDQQGGKHPKARLRLLENGINASYNARSVYQQAFDRWTESLPPATQWMDVPVEGRMVIGLGTAGVLETGIALHHTYGVPWIPGTAVKGLASHYCDRVWGNRDEPDEAAVTDEEWKFRRRYAGEACPEEKREFWGRYHQWLFGTTESAGYVTFHDAWIDHRSLSPKSGLVRDVMTPHHGDYYAGKTYQGAQRKGQRIPPTDFDNPNPITFLSVNGSFRFALSVADPDDANQIGLLGLARQVLGEALRDWGAGGKTNSGYGRFVPEAQKRS